MTELFNNWLFIFPIFFLIYWFSLRWIRVNNILLFLFGVLIYSWGNIERGVLLVILTVIDFLLVKYIYPVKNFRKAALFAGIFINLIIWLFFKYFYVGNQMIETFSFPIGISFYMLRKISYLVDNYRKPGNLLCDFIEYGLFVSFFPQILSGPIEKPDAFLHQIQNRRTIQLKNCIDAAQLIILGLVKKIVIADNLGLIVDRVFRLDYPERLIVVSGSLGFALEVYSDFSGYTDISRGISSLLGIQTAKNFNKPYFASTPSEFWNRWHITFTQWLRNYIFFPLRRMCLKVFSKKIPLISDLFPLLITMVSSGIWHGNGITFLVWGIYHGLLIFFYRLSGLDRSRQNQNPVMKGIKWAAMFVFTLFGWTIFRAPDMMWFFRVIFSNQWGFSDYALIVSLSIISMIFMYALPLILLRIVELSEKAEQITKPIFYATAIILLVIFSESGMQDFVYFDY